MKKLLMVLALGLTLSSVGLAREPGNYFGGGRVEAANEFHAYRHDRRERRREHRRHEHRHFRRDWRR